MLLLTLVCLCWLFFWLLLVFFVVALFDCSVLCCLSFGLLGLVFGLGVLCLFVFNCFYAWCAVACGLLGNRFYGLVLDLFVGGVCLLDCCLGSWYVVGLLFAYCLVLVWVAVGFCLFVLV